MKHEIQYLLEMVVCGFRVFYATYTIKSWHSPKENCKNKWAKKTVLLYSIS